jgi:hypothetical protein
MIAGTTSSRLVAPVDDAHGLSLRSRHFTFPLGHAPAEKEHCDGGRAQNNSPVKFIS